MVPMNLIDDHHQSIHDGQPKVYTVPHFLLDFECQTILLVTGEALLLNGLNKNTFKSMKSGPKSHRKKKYFD
jgi:hypothetical protein